MIELLPRALKLLLTDPRRLMRRGWRLIRPMRGDYRRKFRMTLRQWLLFNEQEIAFGKPRCRWMGVRCMKNPLDMWIYQEILFEVRPDVVVEIGSAEGGTTMYLAHLMDLLGKGVVLSIDFDRTAFRIEHPRVVTFDGRSTDPAVFAKAAATCDGKVVMVIQDADHTKEGVLADLCAYGPLVSVGSYLIVEDGLVDLFRPGDGLGWLSDGPLAATEEFLRTNSEFVVDQDRERYILTSNPRGYLRRVQ